MIMIIDTRKHYSDLPRVGQLNFLYLFTINWDHNDTMSSMNTLNEENKKLLTLDNFLGNLTVPEFVEKLSKDLSLKGSSLNEEEYLDPKPYIRTFESALKELNKLNEECQNRKDKAEKYAESKEIEHSKNVLGLHEKAQNLNQRFSKLEGRVGTISQVIYPLKENLAKANISKENSSTMILLTKCYNEFYRNGKPSDDLVRLQKSADRESKRRAAVIIAKLISISKKLESDDLENSHECHELIQSYGNDFERSLLDLSAQYYQAKTYTKMRELSDILFDYNDGHNLVQFYIGNHPFIGYSIDKWVNNTTEEQYWMKLTDPNFTDFVVDSATSEMTAAIAHVTKNELGIVSQIFGKERTEIVLEAFIIKCFDELLIPRTAYVMRTASSTSNLAEVRTLHALYTDVTEMATDIKKYMNDNDVDFNFSIDQNVADLFDEFLAHDKYISLEKQSLSELIYAQIAEFDKNNEKLTSKLHLGNRIKQYQIDKFENSKEVENIESETFGDSPSNFMEMEAELEVFNDVRKEKHNPATRFLLSRYASSGKSSNKRFARISNFMRSRVDRTTSLRDRLRSTTGSTTSTHGRTPSQSLRDAQYQTTEKEDTLSLARAEKILQYTIEALTRSVELMSNKAADNAIEMCEILLMGIGNTYVTVALEATYTKGVVNQQNSYNYSNPLDLAHLDVIEDACAILYFLSTCIQKMFFPLVSSSQVQKSRLVSLTNGYLSNCELGLDLILKDTAQLVNKKIGAFLANQSNDYFQNREITHDITPTCSRITEFLATVHNDASMYIHGELLQGFLLDIGNSLLEQLLSNLNRFKINSIGGLILTQDTIHFVSLINSWEIESLSEDFQVIREVANLFSVQSDLLPSLIKEGKLAELKPQIVKKYISQRSDYKEGFMQHI